MAKVKSLVKIKPFAISEPVFGSCITFCVGMTYAQMMKECQNGDVVFPKGYDDPKDHESSNGVALACDSKDGQCKYRILWLREANNLPVLVHEIVHSVQFIFKYKGISTTADEPEPMAYFCEFYFKEAFNHLKKKGVI